MGKQDQKSQLVDFHVNNQGTTKTTLIEHPTEGLVEGGHEDKTAARLAASHFMGSPNKQVMYLLKPPEQIKTKSSSDGFPSQTNQTKLVRKVKFLDSSKSLVPSRYSGDPFTFGKADHPRKS